MIIYGWKAAHLKSAQSKVVTCHSCGTKGMTVFSVFGKYAHIFWVPLFPIGKSGASQCQHCKSTLEVKQMEGDVRREYSDLKSETRAPIWQFAGLAIITLAVIWGVLSSKQDAKMELEYLQVPIAGDVYRYKTENKNYSTFKVVGVTSDSIYVSPNEYETTKMSGIRDIDKNENYPDFNYGISKEDIKKMYHEKKIYDINRN